MVAHFAAAYFLRILSAFSLSAVLAVSQLRALEAEEQGLCTAGTSHCRPLEAGSLLQVQTHSAKSSLREHIPTAWPAMHQQNPPAAEQPEEGTLLAAEKPAEQMTSLLNMQGQETSDTAIQRPTGSAPCACEGDSKLWKQPAPRAPRCIFIDLGAANGNTFEHFLKDGYGEVKNCPSGGEFEAILVEANPRFDESLLSLQANYSGRVRSLVSSAAYMCEGFTSFYLDTVDVQQNFWGSSMSPNARDVKRSGKKNVRVPLVNVARLIMESAIPEDYVLVKMDIEGSEHDIMPCLSQSRAAFLIDAVYVEKHPVEWSLAGARQGALQDALVTLQSRGIVTPEYDSPSL